MDPKTDSGMMPSLAEDRFDVEAEVSLENCIWLFDQLLACEVKRAQSFYKGRLTGKISWHTGKSLMQNLFTCRYVESILQLSQRGSQELLDGLEKWPSNYVRAIVLPCVIGCIKSISFALDEFRHGYLYDEEDISLNTFSLNLLQNVNTNTVLALLQSTQEYIENENGIPSQMREALADRVSFRMQILKIVDPAPSESNAPFIEALDFLVRMSTSAHLGIKVRNSFSVSTQRLLASSVPPRPMAIINTQEALLQYRNLLERLSEISKLPVFEDARATAVLDYLRAFGDRQYDDLPYVKSIVVSHFCLPVPRQQPYALIIDFLDEMGLCSSVTASKILTAAIDTSNQNLTHLRGCIENANLIISDVLRICCHNLSRQHRNYTNVLIEIDSLQKTAGELHDAIDDQNEAQECLDLSLAFYAWLHTFKLDILIRCFILGFILDIYAVEHMKFVFSYMLTAQAAKVKLLQSVTGMKQYEEAHQSIPCMVTQSSAMRHVFRCYVMMLTTFESLRLIRPLSKDRQTSEEALYLQRMKPAWPISDPILPSYHDMLSNLKSVSSSSLDSLKETKRELSITSLKLEHFCNESYAPYNAIAQHLTIDVFRDMRRAILGNLVFVGSLIQNYNTVDGGYISASYQHCKYLPTFTLEGQRKK